jgi:hypothetical protein
LLTITDYLISHPSTQAASVPIVPLPTLWSVLIDGLAPIWPASRTEVDGTSIGDAWPLSTMPADAATPQWETIVPFHKLSQWLCYSLMQPMTKLMNIHFAGAELLTGLPEYRNGGLFIDTGVLTLRRDDTKRGLEAFHKNAEREGKKSLEVVPMFTPDDDVIVEWRAVTVGFLDLLLEEVNTSLGLFGQDKLSLPQMLEAGSWKVNLHHPPFEMILHANKTFRVEEKWPKSLDPIPNVLQSPSLAMEPSFNIFLLLSPLKYQLRMAQILFPFTCLFFRNSLHR